MARSSNYNFNSTMTPFSNSNSTSSKTSNPWLQIAQLGTENAALHEQHVETTAKIDELLKRQAEKKAELEDLEMRVKVVGEELMVLEEDLVEKKVILGMVGEEIRGNSERLRGLQDGGLGLELGSVGERGEEEGEDQDDEADEGDEEELLGEEGEQDVDDGGVALNGARGASPAVLPTEQQRQVASEQEDTFEDILGVGNSFYSRPSLTPAASSSRASAVSDHAARPFKAPNRPREQTRSSLPPRTRQPFAPGRPLPPKTPAYLNSYAPNAAAAIQAGRYGPRHLRPEASSPSAPPAPASAPAPRSNAPNRNLPTSTAPSSSQSNKRKRTGNFTGGAADSVLLTNMQARIASTSAKAEKLLVPGRDRMPFGVEERDLVRPGVEGVGEGRKVKRRRGG
ncbi:hypothetical protein CERZMDRAFT_102154 [Cercospora zeae-maydis SCOH1-5]|uniref:Uncharacterized protein n=1 Tax=Cercospora zeae-maydis SCOH1-5 TaxID=717836 RepID=A0A6A6F1R7_9PEZI|nr:hypothetical protein CERZMDRAFT_102154 [Cercospora zeae-maydis SCOH1-5]